MIDFYEARREIMARVVSLPSERVRFLDAIGRFLATDIVASFNVPPSNNSAFDGYIFRHEDTVGKPPPYELQVIDEVPAGEKSVLEVGVGQAIRIMTGAPVPAGGDCVVGVEDTELVDERTVKVKVELPRWKNIRFAGEDISSGSTVLNAGAEVTPEVLGVIASLGITYVSVGQRPRVGILSTGDEIIEPGDVNRGGMIYSSNSYTLSALVTLAGAIPIYYGIARDDRESLRQTLLEMERCDVILTTGGVSMGNYDYVKDVLADIGFQRVFWKVAMKPGKPLLFGTLNSSLVFGLPGNPVSAVTSFREFVRPVIRLMQGATAVQEAVFNAELTDTVTKKRGRLNLVKARYEVCDGRLRVTPLQGQGSGILTSLAKANCLIIIPADIAEVQRGEQVGIRMF